MKALIRFIILWGTVAIGTIFVGRYLTTYWKQLDFTMTPENIRLLIVALVLYCVGMLMLPIGAWVMQRWLGYRLTAMVMWRSFYLAQLSKYLPGGIWSIVGRAFLFTQNGISRQDSGALVILEIIGLVMGSAVVGLFSLPVLLPLVLQAELWVFILLILLFLGGVAVLYIFRQRWLPAFKAVKLLSFAAVCGIYALNWVLLGFAFAFISIALKLPLSVGDIIILIGVHAIAWLVGFVVVFAPGGIGVRDAILAAGLLAFMPMPYPVIISVLARIAWTLGEVISLVIILVIGQINARFFRRDTPDNVSSETTSQP